MHCNKKVGAMSHIAPPAKNPAGAPDWQAPEWLYFCHGKAVALNIATA